MTHRLGRPLATTLLAFVVLFASPSTAGLVHAATGAGHLVGAGAAPSVASESVGTSVNTSLTINLAASDPDSPKLSFAIVANPAHGALAALAAPVCNLSRAGPTCTASVTYSPSPGYTGPDSFTFKANDGASDSNIATISISVGAGAPAESSSTAGPAVEAAAAPVAASQSVVTVKNIPSSSPSAQPAAAASTALQHRRRPRARHPRAHFRSFLLSRPHGLELHGHRHLYAHHRLQRPGQLHL